MLKPDGPVAFLLIGVNGERNETIKRVRHAHDRHQIILALLPLQVEGQRKAQIGNEGKRMGRIDSQRGQNRENPFKEFFLKNGHIIGTQILGLNEEYSLAFQFCPQRPIALLLLVGKLVDSRRNLDQLLAGAQPIGTDGIDFGPLLPFETRNPDHEKFVEVVGRN